jgi:hypothetical protein
MMRPPRIFNPRHGIANRHEGILGGHAANVLELQPRRRERRDRAVAALREVHVHRLDRAIHRVDAGPTLIGGIREPLHRLGADPQLLRQIANLRARVDHIDGKVLHRVDGERHADCPGRGGERPFPVERVPDFIGFRLHRAEHPRRLLHVGKKPGKVRDEFGSKGHLLSAVGFCDQLGDEHVIHISGQGEEIVIRPVHRAADIQVTHDTLAVAGRFFSSVNVFSCSAIASAISL